MPGKIEPWYWKAAGESLKHQLAIHPFSFFKIIAQKALHRLLKKIGAEVD